MSIHKPVFGVADTSYIMAGKLAGITQLVEDFYNNMDSLEQCKKIRAMHALDLSESKKKLSYFLSGWLGGPRLYPEHYGAINIPLAHKHLKADAEDGAAWLYAMNLAIEKQAYSDDFKAYLKQQFKIPAHRIVQASGSK